MLTVRCSSLPTRTGRLSFDEPTHTYRIDDRIVPSVTQIIEAVIPADYGYMTDEQRTYVMQRGVAVHHGCHLFDSDTLDWSSVSPAIEKRIRAWESFRKDFGFTGQPVISEAALGHPNLRYAGRVDRVFTESDKSNTALVDIKGMIVPQGRVQLGGYDHLLGINGFRRCRRGILVQLNDDGTYKAEIIDKRELERMGNIFIACLSVYGFMQAHNVTKGKHERNSNS